MALDFNVDPYYDDFDQTKNFHRILFKPGRAVQARELTQAQTILQDQITKFADNIFKQNSPVTGGQVTTNFNCHYIKLNETYNNVSIDVTEWYDATTNSGLLVRNADGSVVAQVIQATAGSGTDAPTLIVSYKSGDHFVAGDVIYDVNSNLAVQAIAQDATGLSSTASIAEGVFYVLGNFVQIQPSTIVVDKYDNTPTRRVGLTITETIYDYVDDVSLLDPAVGASNYQAPGADRYYIGLTLDSRPIQFGDDQNFVELVRIVDGEIQKMVDGSVYNVIDDYFAKRDYETNGDYVVNDFKLTPKTNVDPTKYTMSIGKGLAYVHGYRVENVTPIDLVSNRARTTANLVNNPVVIDFGPYFYVDNVKGANTSFFDTGTPQTIDFHCVDSANVNTASASYSTTIVGSGFIRGLVFDHATSDTDANTYVYRAYVHNITNKAPTANATGGAASTITLPTTYAEANGAYIGVNISITNGPSAGDFRTITAYNGVSKVATVNQPWTVTPTSASVFTLNFDTKDIDSIVSVDDSYDVIGKAAISATGKVNGETVLQNVNSKELLFNLGNPYVAELTNSVYSTQQVFPDVSFQSYSGGVQGTVSIPSSVSNYIRHLGAVNNQLSTSLIKQNFTIISKSTGEIIEWVGTGRSAALNFDGTIATFTATSAAGLTPFNAIVIAKTYVETADNASYIMKYKNLIQADTTQIVNDGSGTNVNYWTYVDDSIGSSGQVYIEKAGLLGPGQKQSLYLSDVKRIVKIIDTLDSGDLPTMTMYNSPAHNITNNYIFDDGQRDTFYDHASLTLKPGAPLPRGNILVFLDYYQHTGGDGYFCVESYTQSPNPETSYMSIPTYRSSSGKVYSLRDVVDFRPARKNAQVAFDYRYSGAPNAFVGVLPPIDQTIFECDYTYYLGRKDKLVLSKDKSFQIIEGAPSLVPLFPAEPDGSLVIANLTHEPYTGYIPTETPTGVSTNLSIEKVLHKRYTMQDISNIEKRINNIEYYSSLSLLEQKASSLQISDTYGLNRFKNGILVDDFSSYSTADTYNIDYAATINRRDKIMTATQTVKNFPFKSLALVNSLGNLANTTALGYSVGTDGQTNYFALPYTTANVASQKFASRTVNVNPFALSSKEGTLAISPNVDNWVDTEYAPSLLIVDPNMQVFQSGNNVNVLSTGDWKTVTGTTTTTKVNHTSADWGYGVGIGEKSVATTYSGGSSTVYGTYNNIGNTYALNNGYVTDISILPYIRPQQIVVRGQGMLFNTTVNTYFDGENVDNYFRKGNVIELTGVAGTFQEGDVIGYYSGNVFHPTGRVLGVYQKTATTVRLYVAADAASTTYTTNTVVQNAKFNSAGTYTSNTAYGTLSSTSHVGGQLRFANTTTNLRLSSMAPSIDGYYTGNTINIINGSGVGQSAEITAYYGANQTAILATSVTAAAQDAYSIGTIKTNETGSVYGVFNLPENTFHTGQRVFRIDNSGGNPGSETTYSESSFYAEGLQVTQQGLDFGASPAGAKNTMRVTKTYNTVEFANNAWDPVAQTFIVSKDNYPNGFFLDSASFFFRTKPTSDNSSITLSIVNTLNGYPTGETIGHSIVTMSPDKVKISETPQYLDTNTKTTFKFNAPIYIQPGVLYAFILKSNSKEYTLWTASNGDTALKSSTKNLPSDPTPEQSTKIGSAPYVGGLFISQNSQTWSVDQNQSMMFVLDRCVFDTTATPAITYTIPKKLPQRTLFNQSLLYKQEANNISTTTDLVTNDDVLVDAFNITTTDFIPTSTNISYRYVATLQGGSAARSVNINPGKFGTPTQDDIYLDDGKGKRVLLANSDTSLLLTTTLSTGDNAVSPVISDAGLSAFSVKWNINNCELSNNLITVVSGGTGYSNNQTANVSVSISAPTGRNGVQAYATANVVNGVIDAINITEGGSGYITTPTITISDANTTPGSGATVVVAGETSKNGGNALARYVTKKVVLTQGLDSGDLNVYLTAYRPTNTDINVYYKILSRNDTQTFEEGDWQLMTATGNSGTKYSTNRNDLIEFTFAPGTDGVEQGYVSYTSDVSGVVYNTFNQFAIKVVLTTPDSTSVPVVYDLRAIALPPNVNTAF